MIAGAAGSAVLALALGLRHGLDADHLAAIDGLTRCNAAGRRWFAPYCGALFSAGHGGAILAAACSIALFAEHWTPPPWLAPGGAIVSAAILLLLSAYNLRLALGVRDDRAVQPVGLRSGAFAGLLRAPRAWQVALVGALFALSFDALALAVFFAVNAVPAGGVLAAGGLGLAFSGGMVSVDAGNGLWVARLVARSNGASRSASRVMTLTVALVSLLIGACMALSAASESVERWLANHEIAVSVLAIATVLVGYLAASALPRQAQPAAGIV